jgi:tRNA A37 methylthiotransferase MiaB
MDRNRYRMCEDSNLLEAAQYNPNAELAIVLGERLEAVWVEYEAQVAEGRNLDVLVEGRSHKDADYALGQTRGGKTVHFLAGRDFTGKTVQVKVTQAFMWGFIGDLV